MARDEEYLLYPIDTGEEPVCLRCASKMLRRRLTHLRRR
jgi:hypothetical protein